MQASLMSQDNHFRPSILPGTTRASLQSQASWRFRVLLPAPHNDTMTWWNWRRRRDGRKPGEMNFSDNSQITAGPRCLRHPFHSMRCGHPLQIPHVCILNWRHDRDMSYMPVVYMEAFRWNRKSSCKLSIWEPPTGSHRMLNASKCYFLDSLISCKSNYTSILIKLLLEQLRICVRLIILCCWRECHKGICDHTKAFPTTSASCSQTVLICAHGSALHESQKSISKLFKYSQAWDFPFLALLPLPNRWS